MNLFRNLLFWIVLALLGALLAQFLVRDPGSVEVVFRGYRYSTTLAAAVLGGVVTLAAIALLWKLLTAPFAALRRRREKAARARLGEGLDALHQGHWKRAETALTHAAQDDEVAAIARVAAARSAVARGEPAAARQHLEALAGSHPVTRAVALADLALAHDQPQEALVALDDPAAQPLPPRGLALRADALAALGRTGEAYGLLGALRQQQAMPAERLTLLESQWAEAALHDAADANVLADLWDALPKPLKSAPATVAAYAQRAAALRWDEAAARSLEQALDEHWDESLATLYGRLPIGRLDDRRGHAERWLQAHPSSPGALLTLARLSRAQQLWPQAEGYLHRALAQGAGSAGWEELGQGYAEAGDDLRARLSYANALHATRGDAIQALPGRDLKQQIADQAVVEERDEHGVPRLRG